MHFYHFYLGRLPLVLLVQFSPKQIIQTSFVWSSTTTKKTIEKIPHTLSSLIPPYTKQHITYMLKNSRTHIQFKRQQQCYSYPAQKFTHFKFVCYICAVFLSPRALVCVRVLYFIHVIVVGWFLLLLSHCLPLVAVLFRCFGVIFAYLSNRVDDTLWRLRVEMSLYLKSKLKHKRASQRPCFDLIFSCKCVFVCVFVF